MVHNEFEGDVIGKIWRAQESDKEIVYFQVKNHHNWYRIEYTGELMLERANYMASKLKSLASRHGIGGDVEIGVDSDELTINEHSHTRTFNLVRYIQVTD
jgi:hypothetical protein